MHGQLLHFAFVVRREPGGTCLINELDYPSKTLIRWRVEGHRQNLLGAQPATLVPGSIKREIAMEAGEFPLVVGVGDVEAAPMPRDEPDNTLIVERDTNLLHLIEVGKARIDFLAVGVHGIEGETFSVKQAENLIVERDENLIDLLGRVDMGDDQLEPFIVSGLFFERRELGSAVTQIFHDAPFCQKQQAVSHFCSRVVNNVEGLLPVLPFFQR